MCGFTGFWEHRSATQRVELVALVERMAETLRRRGPDDASSWADAVAGLAFGFRRLSIQDLSAAGRQPMASHSGALVIAFNGEVYNTGELREHLGDVPWKGHSDTEVLLEHIEAFGVEPTLRRLDGMFAFAVWDTRTSELTLARDRLGEKPLFYGTVGGVFFFGSQPKSFRPHPAFSVEVSPEALADYVRDGYVAWPRALVRGLAKLGPGHLVRVRRADVVEQRCWWSPIESAARATLAPKRDPPQDQALIEELDAKLRASVQRRLVSDVPIGAFLSGGIDSSLVVSLMAEVSRGPVHTFSIGFQEQEFDESSWARRVAEHLGTVHHERMMGPDDARVLLETLPEIYDEPFGDSSQIPTLLLARFARERVTVALSGDGGDELFSGYPRYDVVEQRWPAVRDSIATHIPTFVGQSVAALLARPARQGSPRVRRFGGRLRRELSATGPGALERFYREQMSYFDPGDALTAPRDVPARWWTGTLASAAPGVRERLQLIDQLTYLPDDILTKVDRATMAASLEARTPFLAPEIVDLAWSLPRSLRVRDGQAKFVLRELLARRVPRALFERPKMGFGVPVGVWLRGPLRDWAEPLLDKTALERFGLLKSATVRRVWQDHLAGRPEHEYRLWPILALQAWCREWLS
ncbi:MAG: asparagine synthase (glutamine-hydrolyzing) [Deltaproteobacteria bacterium]|nr:asparagine synthase (glutamine-hydrolyzing) [Deltaproteobacteria bacterium]